MAGAARWARLVPCFMLSTRIKPRACGRLERLEAGMVDILGMFRRRPAKRSGRGFARSREDITALGDSFGSMLTSPVRDAPPIARDAVTGLELTQAPTLELPREQSRNQPQPRRKAKPAAKSGKGSAPQLLRRPGYLAVHSVEKSFGSRQVVRGVSIYVR